MTLRPEDKQQQQQCTADDSAVLHQCLSETLALTPPSSATTTITAAAAAETTTTAAAATAAEERSSGPKDLKTSLLASASSNCCRICLDDDPHGLYSPCRCRGSIKFVHSHCLTRWRKSLMVHGRDESANACSMCGFKFVLKKRARLHDLISYRGIRILITFLVVLTMMFPAGYIMKACVILSVYSDQPTHQRQSLWSLSTNMDELNIFPICKAGPFSTATAAASLTSVSTPSSSSGISGASSSSSATPVIARLSSTRPPSVIPTVSNYVSLLPGTNTPRPSDSLRWQRQYQEKEEQDTTAPMFFSEQQQKQQQQHHHRKKDSTSSSSSSSLSWWRFRLSSKIDLKTVDYTLSLFSGSWAWVLAGVDVIGASSVAHWVMYPFVDDRLWHLLLCRLHHLHLGFFFLGSGSNVYMACKMLSDMYDLLQSPPHARPWVKQLFLTLCSVFVLWFWFTYNLMAFRVSATEEEFMAELPLWTLRWINVGVAIVDLSYRRVYRRLSKWKMEEELLDISEVEQLEQMQHSIFQLQLLSAVQQYGPGQGQVWLEQVRQQLGEHMGSCSSSQAMFFLQEYATAVGEAVSEVYAKTTASSLSSAAASMLSSTQALAPLCESSMNTLSSALGVQRRPSVTLSPAVPEASPSPQEPESR